MLYPQNNEYRQFTDLSGFWEFRFDPENHGKAQNWGAGFDESRPIAVPASWNDQFEAERDNLGPAWYQTKFNLPWGFRGQQIFLRFGSVNYLAEVWLNGELIGTHEGGHLPFEMDVTGLVVDSANLLVIRVDGNLAPDRVPPGNTAAGPEDAFITHSGNWPQAFFDFFPFCGIQRPVLLYAVPQAGIRDVTAMTEIEGTTGIVKVVVKAGAGEVRATLAGHGQTVHSEGSPKVGENIILRVPDAKLWSPDQPHLYDLTVEL
jgi:beta-glucuronidase